MIYLKQKINSGEAISLCAKKNFKTAKLSSTLRPVTSRWKCGVNPYPLRKYLRRSKFSAKTL